MTPEKMIIAAEEVMSRGSSDAVRASMVLLKASADLSHAHLIQLFEDAEKRIIAELVRLKNADLVAYHAEAALARVHDILQKLKDDAGSEVENLVRANIITGRCTSRIRSKDHELVSAFDLQTTDTKNAERIISQLLGNIYHACDCAEQSVRSKVQSACVKASMSKEYAADADLAVSFPSIETKVYFGAVKEPLEAAPKLTKAEQKEIDRDPVRAAKKIAMDAAKQIKFMQEQYVIGRREADLVRQKTLASVAMKTATGQAMVNAERDLIASMLKDGITAFVDRSGRKWQLGVYCNMAVRTTSRQSQNVGELFDDPEHDLYIIVNRHSNCPICSRYEGRVYSRSGSNPNYPALKEAFKQIDPDNPGGLESTYLSIHPNCRHTLAKWVERAHTPVEIAAMRQKSDPLTNPFDEDPRTEKQIKAYKERERVMGIEAASVRQYRKLLQYIPANRLGSWVKFHKHYIMKDDYYKSLMTEYREKIENTDKST
jgi:hypothetical protein